MGFSPTGPALVLAWMACTTMADFITPFRGIHHGQLLEVTWERLSAEQLPVYISGRVFNVSDSGVTMFQGNVSVDITGNSFTWNNIPYPLPYIPTAQYELEVLSQSPSTDDNDDDASHVLMRTNLFSIAPDEVVADDERRPPFGSPGSPEQPSQIETADVGPSTAVIVAAVCVSLGIPILIAIGFWFWCMRRQRKRLEYEENRRRRYETIIN